MWQAENIYSIFNTCKNDIQTIQEENGHNGPPKMGIVHIRQMSVKYVKGCSINCSK